MAERPESTLSAPTLFLVLKMQGTRQSRSCVPYPKATILRSNRFVQGSVEDVVAQFVEQHCKDYRPRSRKETERLLRVNVLPKIGRGERSRK